MQTARISRSQLEVVTAFKTELEQLPQDNIHVLPDLSGQIAHDGTSRIHDLHLPLGLHVDPIQIEAAGRTGESSTPSSLSFHHLTGYRLGRENSRNGVAFGGLSARWPNDAFYRTEVAVKPAEVHPNLLGELAMLQYMKSLGISTLQPEAYLVGDTDSSGRDYLITRFDGRINTMDNLEWDELDIEERWGQAGLAIETLALLHSNLLFHGDLEFRNTGFGETGEAMIVDPELMVSALELAHDLKEMAVTEEGDSRLIRLKQLMSNDFTQVCTSIKSYVISALPPENQPKNDKARLKILNRHIYKPYRAALIDRGSPYLGVLLSAYDMMARDNRVRAEDNSL